jgi:hypothetical protein
MKSYRVNATGENRAKPDDKSFHVDVTVEAWDDMEAKQKAVAYLNRIYDSCLWQVDSAVEVTGPAPKRPKPPAFKRRQRRV